jgi:hypothetical protein
MTDTTLYFHVGMNKTASSVIQSFMTANRAKLQSNGVCYPASGQTDHGAHHFIACSFLRDEKMPPRAVKGVDLSKVMDDLQIEFEQSGCNSLVISSEMLSFFSDVDADKSRPFFDSFQNKRLIIFLREQNDYARSYYNSSLRIGRPLDGFAEYYESLNLDWNENLLAWENLFDKDEIVVRGYSKSWRDPLKPCKEFLSAIDMAYEDTYETPGREINVSLRNSVLPILRYANKQVVGNRDAFINHMNIAADELEQQSACESPEAFASQQNTLKDFRESNQRLTERYCDGKPIFTEADMNYTAKPGADNVEVLAKIILQQWHEQLAALQLQNQRASIFTKIKRKLARLLRSKTG